MPTRRCATIHRGLADCATTKYADTIGVPQIRNVRTIELVNGNEVKKRRLTEPVRDVANLMESVDHSEMRTTLQRAVGRRVPRILHIQQHWGHQEGDGGGALGGPERDMDVGWTNSSRDNSANSACSPATLVELLAAQEKQIPLAVT